jgi:phospholipid/cholesterol/gamma-HCH transport system substrate-binding protein
VLEEDMFDKKKQLMWSKLKVGLVTTLAFGILFLTIFFAGDIHEIFAPKVKIRADIKDVRGLRKGAPVWFSGIEIGSVKDIELDPAVGTYVTMSINQDDIKFVKKDSKASVMTMGLLGDKYVEISSGSRDAEQVAPGDIIQGTVQVEIQDIVTASSKSLAKVTDFLSKLESLLDKFAQSQGTVAKFLNDPSIYDNLKETTATLSVIVKDINDSEGSFKMFIEDPSIYNRMDQATASLEKFSKNLNEGSGTIAKLVRDPEIYDNLNKASKQLSVVIERIESGEGLAGTLLSDRELSIELKDTVVELKNSLSEFEELIAEIKANPDKYIKFSVF